MTTHLTQIRQLLLRPYFFVVIAIAIAGAMQSCKVTLVASQDAKLIEQIDSVARDIDMLYLQMLEVPAASYGMYSQRYLDIEVQLNAIYDKSRLKEQNVETTKIAKNVRDTWVKYKSEHKAAASLNPGVITYNHTTMADFLYVLMVAENAKPK